MPTPFEIRESLLSRATDYLTQKYYAEFDMLKTLNNSDALINLKYPTTENILALANTYKQFVDSK